MVRRRRRIMSVTLAPAEEEGRAGCRKDFAGWAAVCGRCGRCFRHNFGLCLARMHAVEERTTGGRL